jgi:hypothetical protein
MKHVSRAVRVHAQNAVESRLVARERAFELHEARRRGCHAKILL